MVDVFTASFVDDPVLEPRAGVGKTAARDKMSHCFLIAFDPADQLFGLLSQPA